jgi:VanZ family protein
LGKNATTSHHRSNCSIVLSMKYFLPAIIWSIVIFIACAMPGKDVPYSSLLELLAIDKWVHAAIFFVLVILLMRGMKFTYPRAAHMTVVFFALAIAIPYGGLLEIMQGAFFADRSADPYDFIANLFGAVCGVLLYRRLAARWQYFQPK